MRVTIIGFVGSPSDFMCITVQCESRFRANMNCYHCIVVVYPIIVVGVPDVHVP